MKPTLFLRSAAVLTFLHAVLHTIGGVFSKPDPGSGTVVMEAMKANRFLLVNVMRSYADLYRGMGLMVTIFLTVEALVFWQLASMAKIDAHRLRPILATFAVAYLVLAVNSYAYFFIAPILNEILIAACLGLAIFTTTRNPNEEAASRKVSE
jgi:hypothetical protein